MPHSSVEKKVTHATCDGEGRFKEEGTAEGNTQAEKGEKRLLETGSKVFRGMEAYIRTCHV